jgi:hypothetical protein
VPSVLCIIIHIADTPPLSLNIRRYTRNGVLLGDAFTDVAEPVLVPVVGFHSNGECVRVNFGLSPWVYTGAGIVDHPAALAERALTAATSSTAAATSSTEVSVVRRFALRRHCILYT